MAQPPFLLDVLQIEPGSGDTLTISRDTAHGGMEFVDAVVSSGVLLQNLIGLKSITGVYLVGRAGDGAAYTTIQDALDAIPDSSSATAPSVVLIMAGVYTETITIQKDGVYLFGLGGVTINNSGANHTIEISAWTDGTTSTTPQNVLLQNLSINNDQATQSCIRCIGADSFASGTLTVDVVGWATGDTVTIGGTPLTAVAGTRTSGSDDFSVSAGTTDAQAAEIAAAINDASNSFAATVVATVALNVVTITAKTAGSGGDAISLASSVTLPGADTLSGGNLTGGGAANSMVLNGKLVVRDCDLVATDVAGFQLNADVCGHIYMLGGTGRGSAAGAKFQLAQVALGIVDGVDQLMDVEVSWDTTLDRPFDGAANLYSFANTKIASDVLANMSGGGQVDFRGCQMVDFSLAGDRWVNFLGSQLQGLALGDTSVATLRNSSRGTLSLTGGTPTISEDRFLGSQAFVGSNSETITFDIPQGDANYTVLLDTPTTAETYSVQNKLAASFDIVVSGVITDTVNYVVLRDL